MEVDTEAAVSVMSEATRKKVFPQGPSKTYTDETLERLLQSTTTPHQPQLAQALLEAYRYSSDNIARTESTGD